MLLNWADEPEVVSDPYSVLPVCTGKTIRECTAIHLGGRNITRIDHFERFVNLNVLYLNDNRIQRVDNLESCFRLRELYLNNNRVSTLKTESFAALHYLKRLSLSGNRLKNLLETLPLLKHMTQLDNLGTMMAAGGFRLPRLSLNGWGLQIWRAILWPRSSTTAFTSSIMSRR